MTLEELLAVAEIVEKLTNRYRDQEAAHKAALAELRASCNARTASDEHRPENLREEIIRLNDANGRLLVERDTLRGEVAALQERLRASIARGDFAQMEVAALKPQIPKHPVKVGEWLRSVHGEIARVAKVGASRYELFAPGLKCWTIWHFDYCEPCDPPQTEPVPKCAHPVAVGGYLRRLTGFNTTPAGEIARVTLVEYDDPLVYEVARPNGQTGRWSAKYCEPCDPPEADHDTEAGKAAAVAALKTEPVAEEIKVGDMVEVVSNRGRNTWLTDVGSVGTVTSIETLEDSLSVRLKAVPDKKNVCGGYVSICDVRKVTT